MEITCIPKIKTLKNESLEFHFLETGDIYNITSKHYQINLLRGNVLDGMVSNIYLKLIQDDSVYITPLLGVHSPSSFELLYNQAIYTGIFKGVSYQVHLWLDGITWSYQVSLSSTKNTKAYLYYGQDLAIQSMASVLNSEPYTVQYIDYRVFNESLGYVLLARQNQGDANLCQIWSDTKTISYSTDGFQFFGLDYKKTNSPKALFEDQLQSEIYQYEFSYFALQTECIDLSKEESTIQFHGLFQENHVPIISKAIVFDIKDITLEESKNNRKIKGFLHHSPVINGERLSEEDLIKSYPNMEHKEYEKEELLSFFTDKGDHIVLQEKELLSERPHGHLMIHGDLEHASKNVMATSNYMHGVFQSHVVLGNTTFNKLMGDVRNPLHLQKTAGLHIYIKIEDSYQMLNLPSYYEMSLTETLWHYQLEDAIVRVKSMVDINYNHQYLQIESTKKMTFLLQYNIIMNGEEFQKDLSIEENGNTMTIHPIKDTMLADKYPSLSYELEFDQATTVLDPTTLLGTDATQGLFFVESNDTKSFETRISGSFEEHKSWNHEESFEELKTQGRDYFRAWVGSFEVDDDTVDYKKLNTVSLWYSHNALVHYASPHGLEQYNGAAWGTRDICQGPAEFFMASDRYDLVREVLLKIYSRQFIENGDFPQWFMFDEYYQIQALDSHGDIILWPLRLLATYINATDDISILDEKVSYMSIKENTFTKELYTIKEHISLQVQAILESFVEGTSLPRYGGGDWDDTLQPANQTLKEKMVSGWTIALLYDALHLWSDIEDYFDIHVIDGIKDLLTNVKKDYDRYLLVDNHPVGFTVFNDPIEYLIYEKDTKTNIQYRLLPYIRSIISNMVDNKEAEEYFDIIKENLLHKDGVRLMNKVVSYKGGQRSFFQRAETAANFGREIGLQYVHAHIRYVESLFTTGHTKEGLEGLLTICPITIQEVVPNAKRRQSNMYFSSSDADVKTRYEAEEKFSLLKEGLIPVKGGWRLYSSGPGIYIKQVMDNIIGIKRIHNKTAYLVTNNNHKVTHTRNNLKTSIQSNGKNNLLIINNEEVQSKDYRNNYGRLYKIMDQD